ncbi:hypothetical protein HK105_200335 [Polyrhizophydium stewartii]|uniref:Synaptobrevin homolog YKT6 n=1 Tax=Polyrhizophydium stewartii TaxID=2732419 RepID=A0ABR4NLB4_9FUNG|nr:Vesicle-associated membrane protein [Polyrhizophydium stewartii]
MPLVYALVARGTLVLAEHAITTGNFTTITQHLLAKIPSGSGAGVGAGVGGDTTAGDTAAAGTTGDTRVSYSYDAYMFHCLGRAGVTYLCLADEAFGRRVPFAFLEDLARRFQGTYGERAKTAITYGLQEFAPTMAQMMESYSSGSGDRFAGLQNEIDQVRGIMVNNIEKVLERGERIDLLVDKTEALSQASFAFKKRSTALRRAMWWKNTRLMILLVVVMLCLILIGVEASSCTFF